jgi:O-antigen/teichoic acid export membrane protein
MRFHRFKRLAKEGNWLVISQIGTVVSAVILIRLLTEYLSFSEYGKLILGLTLASLFNSVISNCISLSITRYYSIAVEVKSPQNYLHSTFHLLKYASLIIVLCSTLIIGGLIYFNYHQWIWLIILVSIFAILDGYNVAFLSIQNAARQRNAYSILNLTNHVLKIPLSLVAITWFGNTSTSVVLAYIISLLTVNVIQILFLRKINNTNEIETHSISFFNDNMLKYSSSFSIIGIFTWIHISSDRWLLQIFSSTTEVAVYNVIFQLGYVPVGLATGLITSFIAPILYQRVGNANDAARNESAQHIVWYISLIGILVTIMTFATTLIFHKLMFSLLVAKEYQFASYMLPWVILSGGMFATGQVLALKLMSEMKLSALINIKISTAILGVCFNIFGIQYGLQGMVAALLAFSSVYFLWMLYFFKNTEIKKLQKNFFL